jgi:hypothetical protein
MVGAIAMRICRIWLALVCLVLTASTALAESVQLRISGTASGLIIECAPNKRLTFKGPIPSVTAPIPLGNAVAVIVESTSIDPEILVGVVEGEGGEQSFAIALDSTSPIIKALGAGAPLRISRRHRSYVISQHAADSDIQRVVSLCQTTPTGHAYSRSMWRQAGSVYRLEATGLTRKFLFSEPSQPLTKQGVSPGTVRFDGELSPSTRTYQGTAYLFWRKCGPRSFKVVGQIENNDRRVVLIGEAPRLNDQCVETGKVEQRLVFDFIDGSATTGSATTSVTTSVTTGSVTTESSGDLRVRTAQFLKRYYGAESSSDAEFIGLMSKLYADRVDYFGKSLSRDEVIGQLRRFFERWPNRNYVPRDSATVIECVDSSRTCTAKGILDFDAYNATRNDRSAGVATFDFTLSYAGTTDPVVLRETGSVVQRQTRPLSSTTDGPNVR